MGGVKRRPSLYKVKDSLLVKKECFFCDDAPHKVCHIICIFYQF